MPTKQLESCSCGILFAVPHLSDPDCLEHFSNRKHYEALKMPLCGPCFVGICNGCEKSRGGKEWRCSCSHARSVGLGDIGRFINIAYTWSQWLSNGAPSEATGRLI